MATTWRIKMNSGRPGVDWDGAKAYARQVSVVGLGWGPDGLQDGTSLERVLETVDGTPGWSPTGPRMIRRLAEQMADGDYVWTRDGLGWFWLGRVEGPWRYDGSPEAYARDLNNVRPCTWLSRPMRDFEVPGSVVRNFAGTGETLRRIKQPAAMKVTEMLWAREADPSAARASFSPQEAITDLLDPIDVEDLVLLLLQSRGWLLLPSSRMHDTPLYEAALRHQDDGRLAVVSVKSGASAPVPVERLRAAAGSAEAFAYSTHDRYTDPPDEHGVTALTGDELMGFMAARPELLPPRVAQWL